VYSPLILFTASNVYAGIIFNKNVDEHLTYEKFIHQNYPKLQEKLLGTNSEDNLKDLSENSNEKQTNSKNKLKFSFFIGLIILMLAFMISNINQSIAQPFYQVYLIDVLNVKNAVIVMLIYFPSQIVSLLIAPKLGEIADRINPILGIFIVNGLAALNTWLLLNSISGIMFGIILIFDSTFIWAGMLIMQNVLSRISREHRGKIFGTKQFISLLGGTIGPIAGGIAWQVLGPQYPFILSIFIVLSVIPFYVAAIILLRPYMAEKV
ncbi:MAG: hypothetical protein P8Y97_06430, partial [Candidatus Lokiarchaeota archaeon]